jgi:hypothetical protein
MEVGIGNRPPTRFCESQLENSQLIPGFFEQKAEVAIGNRPRRRFCESQLGWGQILKQVQDDRE